MYEEWRKLRVALISYQHSQSIGEDSAGCGKFAYAACTGILVSHGKNEILLFATTWMDLEGLSEYKSDGEKQILYGFIHMWN